MLLLLLGVLAEAKDCSPTQLPCGSTPPTRGNCLPTSSWKTLPRSSAAISVLYNSLFSVPSDFWIVNCQFFVPLMRIVCIFGVPFTRTFHFKLCFNFLVGYPSFPTPGLQHICPVQGLASVRCRRGIQHLQSVRSYSSVVIRVKNKWGRVTYHDDAKCSTYSFQTMKAVKTNIVIINVHGSTRWIEYLVN